MKLNEFEAAQLALLLLAGVPAFEAVRPFLPPEASDEAIEEASKTLTRQRAVAAELERQSGGAPWQELRKEERLQIAIDKHYAEMAYFLWTHNYSDLTGADKIKADTCRAALEAKLAGTAGKGNVLDRFYEEILAAKRMETLKKVGNA